MDRTFPKHTCIYKHVIKKEVSSVHSSHLTCVVLITIHNSIYRIAGNIGREKTLVVGLCKLKFVNIKSVKLKIRYKNTCDCRHIEVEREKRYCLTRTTVLFYLQRSSRKSTRRSSSAIT